MLQRLIKEKSLYLLITTLLLNKLGEFYIHSFDKSATQDPLSLMSRSVVLSLLYFDIFSYPLTAKEVGFHSSSVDFSESVLNKELNDLESKNFIKSSQGYFFLAGRESTVERRIAGNEKANEYILKAQKISKFISYFPFVKGIFISGSVAKGYADKDSDIDYFIVTAPNRLWLSRTLLILFKKTILLNSKKYFCLNYFIDTEHLEIQDKNIFTAVELCYLLPTYNEVIADKMVQSNNWTKEYLPNYVQKDFPVIPENNSFIKKGIEKLFSGSIGNKLDDFCLSVTERFWKYKFRKTLGQNSIRCKKYVSKFHPQNFQDRVLDKYEEKISSYEQMYKTGLRA